MNVQPFKSPTLPPATTTNAVIVGSTSRWLVDPAATNPAERQRLARWATEERDTRGLQGIALTHHHRDHVGAAAWLAGELGLPIAAHARTAALSRDPDLVVSRPLAEGDTLCDDWVVLHTPGHASDHLCFVRYATGEAVVGDMVAAEGTIAIDPPDGHMGTYLVQLGRLKSMHFKRIVPAHGAPILDPQAHFQTYIEHRLGREALVRAALGDAPQTVTAVTAASYPGLDRRLLPLAERACLAHLEYLFEKGAARWVGPEAPEGSPRPALGDGNLWRI